MFRVDLSVLILVAACAANPSRNSADGGAADGSAFGDSAENPDGEPQPSDGGVVLEDGRVCERACTVGEATCSGAQVQRCETDASGCPALGEPEDCEMGLFCSAGVCSSDCSDACALDAVRCGPDGAQLCEEQASGCRDWSPATACGAGEDCVDEVGCMACVEGTERCGSSGVEKCSGGEWRGVETCPFGCMDAQCQDTVTCTGGAYRCFGRNVETCNSSGTAYLHIRTCAQGCAGGLCTGACEPGETRCNGDRVESCNDDGSAWDAGETCSTFCSRAQCARDGLEVASNITLDGDVVVAGDVVVRSGATLSAPGGMLTIWANSIVVEAGGSISVAPVRDDETRATDGYFRVSAQGGRGGTALPQHTLDPTPGQTGGRARSNAEGSNGGGGGVLRLIADELNIGGQLTANGGNASLFASTGTYGGGGGGGSILVAGTSVVFSGTVSAEPGSGNRGGREGNAWILHGTTIDTSDASLPSYVQLGLLPPVEISSSTHTNTARWYNDGIDRVALSWSRPFQPITGYYWAVSHRRIGEPPTPSDGFFVDGELASVSQEDLAHGVNYFQIASVDSMASVGTVQSSFQLQINTEPPRPTSESHSTPNTWYDNANAFFRWTFEQDVTNFRGVYYVLDHWGDTVPTKDDSFIQVAQAQVLLSDLDDGVYGFHIVSEDTAGYLTRAASHHVFRVGTDPGEGSVFGQVIDAETNEPIQSAAMDMNRGLIRGALTSRDGNAEVTNVPVGEWEVRVSKDGYETATQMVTVAEDQSVAANFSLMPEAP